MGCDIRPVVELAGGDQWFCEARGDLGIPRSYALFTALAGIRDEGLGIAPVASPRGIPDDADWSTRDRLDPDDYHSASWLTLDEVREAHGRVKAAFPEEPDMRTGLEAVMAFMAELSPDPKKVRLVFAFDN